MSKEYLKTIKHINRCMISKKAMSDVVATVMITTISILAVAIVGIFIFNFMNDNSISLSDLDLKINKVEAFYNNLPIASQIINANEFTETTYVSIERGSDSSNLTGLKFIFSVDGNSYECIRRTVPNILETSVYAFKSSIFNKKPEKVEVVPLVRLNNKERVARGGFFASIVSETGTEFGEKYNECGGFCCGINADLPPSPGLP